MIILSTLKGLSLLQIAQTLLAQAESQDELDGALNNLYPCGPGGVGHAQHKAKTYMLELIRDIRSEPRLHRSFYQAPGLC